MSNREVKVSGTLFVQTITGICKNGICSPFFSLCYLGKIIEILKGNLMFFLWEFPFLTFFVVKVAV